MSHASHDALSNGYLQRLAIFERAQAWTDASRYDLAERTLTLGLRDHPQDPHIHALLAQVLIQTGRLDEVESHIRLALSMAPADPFCLAMAGRAYAFLGHHRQAEQFFVEALRQDPEDAETLLGYAALMQKTGHLKKAQSLVEASLRIVPDNEYAHGLLAIIHSEGERSGAKAVGHGAKSLQLNSGADFSHYSMAVACFNSCRPFSARLHAREAARLDPSDAESIDLYRTCDLHSRWTYLPKYYTNWICNRLPGGPYALWGMAVLVLFASQRITVLQPYSGHIAIGWLSFCAYTWMAIPLTKLWIKVIPPR